MKKFKLCVLNLKDKIIFRAPFILVNILSIFIFFSYTYNTYLFSNKNEINKILITLNDKENTFEEFFITITSYVIITIFYILFLISLFKASFSNPGYIPSPLNLELPYILNNIKGNNKNSYEEISSFTKKFTSINIEEGPLTESEYFDYKNKLEKFYIDNNKGDNLNIKLNIVLCLNCHRFKKERTHHCKICNKCVLRMDHHCPWLSNCIGINNYKYFVLIIFYGFLQSFLIMIFYFKYIIIIFLSNQFSLIYNIIHIFAYFCNFYLLCFFIYLIKNNFYNVIKNRTTIEKAEENSKNSKFWNINNNNNNKNVFKYDKGIINNFYEIFGNNPNIWFFPF